MPEIQHYAEGKCTHQMTKCIHSTEIIEPFSFEDIFHLFVRSSIQTFVRLFYWLSLCVFLLVVVIFSVFLCNVFASTLWAFHKVAYEIPWITWKVFNSLPLCQSIAVFPLILVSKHFFFAARKINEVFPVILLQKHRRACECNNLLNYLN